jgi:hypothetical protein
LNAQVPRVEGRSGERISVRLRTSGGERAIDGSDLLVAVGREPNTRGIGLDNANGGNRTMCDRLILTAYLLTRSLGALG